MSLFHRMADADALYRQGMAAFNRGRWQEALAILQEVARASRHSSNPLHLLATFYAGEAAAHLGRDALLAGDASTAARHLDSAAAVSPASPDLEAWRAAAFLLLGDLDAARIVVERARALDPNHLEARCVEALVLQAAGRTAAARAAAEQVHEILRCKCGKLPPRAVALVRAVTTGVPGSAGLRLDVEAVTPASSEP